MEFDYGGAAWRSRRAGAGDDESAGQEGLWQPFVASLVLICCGRKCLPRWFSPPCSFRRVQLAVDIPPLPLLSPHPPSPLLALLGGDGVSSNCIVICLKHPLLLSLASPLLRRLGLSSSLLDATCLFPCVGSRQSHLAGRDCHRLSCCVFSSLITCFAHPPRRKTSLQVCTMCPSLPPPRRGRVAVDEGAM